MSKIAFTKDNHVQPLTLVLVRKDYSKIGVIHGSEKTFKDNFNEPDELSCKVYKHVDGLYNTYWDHINDFNALYVPELGENGQYFEMQVSVNEDTEGTYKTITGTALAEAELSNTKLYDLEINTEFEMENDPEWSAEYHTVFYRNLSGLSDEEYKKMKHVSLLHRILDKAQNYTIKHVDETLLHLTDWYQFSISDSDVYTVLTKDIAEQYHVWFKFDSSDRSISAYDLYSTCENNSCSYRAEMYETRKIQTRYRGDFRHQCPYCGSTHITSGYGIDTKIFASKDNIMSSGSISSNKDNLKNCFRLSAGDDLMTAAIMNQNPNGSQYIYQFSDEQKAEMPTTLVGEIERYNTEYDKYYNGDLESGKGVYSFDANSKVYIKNDTSVYAQRVNSSDRTINSWRREYNDLIDFLVDQGFSESSIGEFEKIPESYMGYQALSTAYYKTIDLEEFILDSMVPDVETNNESLQDTVNKLNQKSNIDPIAVTNPRTSSVAIVNSAIEQVAKCVCNTALYDINVDTEYQNSYTPAASADGTGTWRGRFIVSTIYYKNTDEEDENTAYTNVLTITVSGDETKYISQSVKKLIKVKDARVKSLFDTSDFEDPESKTPAELEQSLTNFTNQLKHYGLNYLANIVRPAYTDVQSVIIKAGSNIQELYAEYYNTRKEAIDEAIEQREAQYLDVLAVKSQMEQYRLYTQEQLDFSKFLGNSLWKVFCSYRREDSYSNSNYVSDGLTNAEMMQRAREFIDAAQKELFKVSHLQYDLDADLYDLLNIPEFHSITDEFDTGNWIHLEIDNKVYDLRLLSYEINYDDLSSIDVSFSTVEQLWTGASDIKSVLDAAGSMAGSFSNFSQQVRRQEDSFKTVQNWLKKGLDATYVRYVNDPTKQEIVYDQTGLLARSVVDTGGYDDRQVKLLGSGLYTTSDNWATVDAAIGSFSYYDPETHQYVNDYGIIAKTIVGNLILGENLKIINESANFAITNNGLSLSNNTNTFTVNPNNNNKLLSIANGLQDVFWVDNQGNLHLHNIEVDGITASNFHLASGETIPADAIEDMPDFSQYDIVAVNTLLADYEEVGTLAAMYANIENLTSDVASIDTLYVKKESVNELLADYATVNNLTAATGRITNLESDVANVKSLYATTASVETLLADYTSTAVLEANYATIADLHSNYVTTDLANVQAGSITAAMIGTGVVGTAQIADGAITSAKIVSLDAAKITTGTLDASLINVINLNAASITAGTITAREIRSGTIDENLLTQQLSDKIEAAGMAMVSSVPQYTITNSTNPPDAQAVWSVTPPDYQDGQYIWERTVITYASGQTETTDPVRLNGTSGQPGQDGVVLRIESSRGNSFKNKDISTELTVTIYTGSLRITDLAGLRNKFGVTAYLQWYWRRLNDDTYGIILPTDSKLSNDGFTMTLTPNDVDTKVTFLCEART